MTGRVTAMFGRLCDYLAMRPQVLAIVACLLLAMLCGWAISWYFISPDSPYNREGTPFMERAIYSDHLHH